MKNKWLKINCIILTMIISQIIIFLDLKNLGNTSSGGGFFEYGFGIKFSIFILQIFFTLYKNCYKIYVIDILKYKRCVLKAYHVNLWQENRLI